MNITPPGCISRPSSPLPFPPIILFDNNNISAKENAVQEPSAAHIRVCTMYVRWMCSAQTFAMLVSPATVRARSKWMEGVGNTACLVVAMLMRMYVCGFVCVCDNDDDEMTHFFLIRGSIAGLVGWLA